jgi:hypothetical protein
MGNEDIHGGTGSARRWPDDVDERILYELADYHWTVKRSLRAAADRWHEAGPAERAGYLDELAELRAKEQRTWAAYLARPMKGTP